MRRKGSLRIEPSSTNASFSRFILAWELKTDMTSASISEVLERAVEWTGMKSVPVQDRTRLLSDNGSSYLSHAFEDYMRMLGIRHIRCAPHHPQTNGKIERFHETLKARLNLLVYTSPEQLRAAMAGKTMEIPRQSVSLMFSMTLWIC